MTKKIWLSLVLVALLIIGYYYLKSQGQLSNITTTTNQLNSSTGNLIAPTGSVDVAVKAILQAAADDRSVLTNDTGENILVDSISQQMDNLNKSYENQF